MKPPHPVFQHLAEARRAKGLTQVALGRRLYLTHTTISQRELGRSIPDLDEVDRHARELGYQVALIPLEGNE